MDHDLAAGRVSAGDALEAFYSALLDDDAEKLYEQAPCGYLSTTPDGVILKVNQTFLTLTGFARADLLGLRTFASLLNAGGRIYHETHLAPMIRMHGGAREIALEIVRADGRRLPVLVNCLLESDPNGDPMVVRMAIFDATQRRQYERELLEATRRAEEAQLRAAALARTLQQTLIPPAPPRIPDLDVAAVYRPAGTGDEVGGDFYDVFEVRDGDWVAVLGDVSGKGVEAAVVTALARYTVRAACVRRWQPSAALAVLNEVLLRDDTERFCTAAILRLHRNSGRWTCTVSCGGHPLPLLTRIGEEPVTLGRPGSLLGVREDTTFHDEQVVLAPGDSIVVYTDGVTEGRRGQEFYGEDRLHRAVIRHGGTASSLVEGVLSDVLEFQSGIARDDIAVLAVRAPEQG